MRPSRWTSINSGWISQASYQAGCGCLHAVRVHGVYMPYVCMKACEWMYARSNECLCLYACFFLLALSQMLSVALLTNYKRLAAVHFVPTHHVRQRSSPQLLPLLNWWRKGCPCLWSLWWYLSAGSTCLTRSKMNACISSGPCWNCPYTNLGRTG